MKDKFLGLLKRVLLISPVVIVILSLLSGLSLYYVFRFSLENSVFSIVVYVLSFYTLTADITSLVFFLRKFNVKEIKKRYSERSVLVKRYFEDKNFHFFLIFSFSIPLNVFYAVFKTVCGVYVSSSWMIENGIYYLFLSFMRLLVVMGAAKGEKKSLRILYLTLTFSSFPYLFMVLEMYFNSYSPHYPGYIVYAAALYSFLKMGSAIKGVIQGGKASSPFIKGGNILKINHALVSMIFLESGMLNVFGEGMKGEKTLLLISGSAVALSLFLSFPLSLYFERKKGSHLPDFGGR